MLDRESRAWETGGRDAGGPEVGTDLLEDGDPGVESGGEDAPGNTLGGGKGDGRDRERKKKRKRKRKRGKFRIP